MFAADDPVLAALLLVPAGLVAGALNVVAGGGSFLTLPLLIFLGLPHHAANGTNRFAVLLQTVGATAAFRRAGAMPRGIVPRLGPACALGAVAGSLLVLRVGETAFLRVLAIVMVLFTLAPLLRRRGPEAREPADDHPPPGAALFVAFLLMGFYGGFVQAGVGFLSLGVTSWAGYGLVAGNAIKVACISLFSVVSLAIFSANAAVDWPLGLSLGFGTLVGGLIGTRLSILAGDRILRFVVSAATLAFAVALWLRT